MNDNKNKKNDINYFEIIFIFASIFFFLLLIFSIQWLKGSLYQAKDDASVDFLNNYHNQMVLDSEDPLIGVKGSSIFNNLSQPLDNNNDPSLGLESSKIKIFYFSDFSCSFCLEQDRVIRNVYDKFSQEIRVVWKDYPDLSSLENFSYQAARAARCANEQGLFWDYNNLLYNKESDFNVIKGQLFINLADNLKLNMNNFKNCLSDIKVDNDIMNNVFEAESLGLVGIPYIYINDIDILGDFSEEELEEIIKIKLAN